MLTEEASRRALHARKVVPLAVANPHGPPGLEQLAAAHSPGGHTGPPAAGARALADRTAGKEDVMIELTEEQRREISGPEPLAIDPETRQAYVLVRKEVYDRLKALLALDDYDPMKGSRHQRSDGGGRRQRPAPGELPALWEGAMNRGDVVIVPFPFQDRPGEKIRPR